MRVAGCFIISLLAAALTATGAVAQSWFSSRSDTSELALSWLSTFGEKIQRDVICGSINNSYSLTIGSGVYAVLARHGYFAEEIRKNDSGKTYFALVPTDNLKILAAGKEGNCLLFSIGTIANIEIVNERPHERYSTVTVVNATYTWEATSYGKLLAEAGGTPTGTDRRARFVVTIDEFSGKLVVVALDLGNNNGWWSGNNVPNAMTELNVFGLDVLMSRKSCSPYRCDFR